MARSADDRPLMTPGSEALREATDRPTPEGMDVGQFDTGADRSDPTGRRELATDDLTADQYEEAAEAVDEHLGRS